MLGTKEARNLSARRTINCESNSQPEFREDNIAESMVEMLEHVQQLDNEEMPNARDVEDWLNLENELPTSPQMSD